MTQHPELNMHDQLPSGDWMPNFWSETSSLSLLCVNSEGPDKIAQMYSCLSFSGHICDKYQNFVYGTGQVAQIHSFPWVILISNQIKQIKPFTSIGPDVCRLFVLLSAIVCRLLVLLRAKVCRLLNAKICRILVPLSAKVCRQSAVRFNKLSIYVK